jgi:hypothetical protein
MFDRIKRKWLTQRVKQAGSQRATGQSLVEMAIISPLLILMLIGVLEVGWAIRGYVVLVNADREATRFSARGYYLDFNERDPNNIGYSRVVSHTLDSLARQLPFDVLSPNPNGTLIVSHFVVDTGKPCADPPCNDDCAAAKEVKGKKDTSVCDCSSPDRREPDYPYDDWVAHPGMPEYQHFTALYGIPRESRINYEEEAAKLKEQNDAFNCQLNLKDPAAPWSVNSGVMVEMFYDQPQLLGVPIISNYFTDPVHFYSNTWMRINSMSEESGLCELLPIAVYTNTLASLNIGDPTGNIRNGTASGDFGWLRWNIDTDVISSDPNSSEYLAEEIDQLRLAGTDYQEAYYSPPSSLCPDTDDTKLNAGDCVWGLTGNVNSDAVRDQLDARIGQVGYVPVWDQAELRYGGSNVAYHIVRFAKIRLTGYKLTTTEKWIWGTFEGWDDKACIGNDH